MKIVEINKLSNDEISKLPFSIWVKFNCLSCGKEVIMFYKPISHNKPFLHRYTSKLCNYCWIIHQMQIPGIYLDPLDKCYVIEDKGQLLKIPDKKSFKFRCAKCGKEVKVIHHFSKKRDYKRFSTLLCQSCQLTKIANDTPKEIWELRVKKSLQVKKEKYGADNLSNQKQANITKFKEYGTLAFCTRYKYYGMTFHSSWEFVFWLYYYNTPLKIIREPAMLPYFDEKTKRSHYYIPDFQLNDGYIEIKGDHLLNSNGELNNFYSNKINTHSKSGCMKRNNVKLLLKKDIEPYIKWIKIIKNAEYLNSFNIHNPNALCWGYSPFNVDFDSSENVCTVPIGLGFTPYSVVNFNANNGWFDFTNYCDGYIPANGCAGTTPYSKKDNEGYCEPVGSGVTPFDIR